MKHIETIRPFIDNTDANLKDRRAKHYDCQNPSLLCARPPWESAGRRYSAQSDMGSRQSRSPGLNPDYANLPVKAPVFLLSTKFLFTTVDDAPIASFTGIANVMVSAV